MISVSTDTTSQGVGNAPVVCAISNGSTDAAGPFVCTLTTSGPAGTAGSATGGGGALPTDTEKLSEVVPWVSGPLAQSNPYVYGVRGGSPASGVGATVLQAIDAALAGWVLDGGSFVDPTGVLNFAILNAWTLWRRAKGPLLPGGDGGQLQAPIAEMFLDTGTSPY